MLSEGETFNGPMTKVRSVEDKSRTTVSNTTPSNGMASVWDAVYGPGYYLSHVLGSHDCYSAVITGDKGTILIVEVFQSVKEKGTVTIKGVAKDNKDNVYKIVN